MLKRLEQQEYHYQLSTLIELPTLISSPLNFYCFERQKAQPNFVTHSRVEAKLYLLTPQSTPSDLEGKIILIPQADPGFDWLFGCGIVGLVTQYGGANSHMTIRAAELGLPAAIGVGDELYENIAHAKQLELDCINQLLRIVQ